MSHQTDLFTVHQIARHLGRTHRSVALCIKRLGIEHRYASAGRPLYEEDVIEAIQNGMRKPNRETEG